jgi:hypothetical protein
MASQRSISKGSKLDTPILPGKLVSGVQTATPSAGKAAGNKLTGPVDYFNRSVTDFRSLTQTEAIRRMARAHGDTSTAVWTVVRLADTPIQYRVYDANHQIDPKGAQLLRSILTRMEFSSDYTQGYDARLPMSAIRSVLLRDTYLYGGAAAELVLDDLRLPMYIKPIPVRTLSWVVSKQKQGVSNKIIPLQKVGNEQAELDYPTVFYVPLDQDGETAYSASPIEPALNSAPAYSELLEDIRKVVRRSGHSRLKLKLVVDQVIKSAPSDIRSDPVKLQAWLESVRTMVKNEVEKLDPEMALVLYDMVEADYLNSEVGAGADYSPLVEVFDGVQSTSLKTPPSVLGKRMGGSQNVSSTESLLFIKTAEGVQPPAAAVLSRALTLAMRLHGFDGYVVAQFGAVNLRPTQELESFALQAQTRTLELLSLGFITDDEAAVLLGTGPRAPGAPPLSGTFFHDKNSNNQASPDPKSDPIRNALTGNSPRRAGGKDNAPK